MKAIVCDSYGGPEVIKIREIETPKPKENEVLVKVLASSINHNTLSFVSGKPFVARFWSGLVKPKLRPGNDAAGRVEAVGKNVRSFKPGDEVFTDLSASGFGSYAEYVCAPENVWVTKPANISFEEAGGVPEAAVVALQGLRNFRTIQPREKVLICGASGGIGTFAVQIAKSFGVEVTAVCSERNIDLVRSIGADEVFVYTREDFTRNGRQYDFVLATAGYRPILDYRKLLRPGGVYVSTGGSMNQVYEALFAGPLLSLGGKKKMAALYARQNQADLSFVKDLMESGKVKTVIDRVFPLSETGAALEYYCSGKARGKVVLALKE